MPVKYVERKGGDPKAEKPVSSVSASKSKKICAKMNELRSLLTCTGSTQKYE